MMDPAIAKSKQISRGKGSGSSTGLTHRTCAVLWDQIMSKGMLNICRWIMFPALYETTGYWDELTLHLLFRFFVKYPSKWSNYVTFCIWIADILTHFTAFANRVDRLFLHWQHCFMTHCLTLQSTLEHLFEGPFGGLADHRPHNQQDKTMHKTEQWYQVVAG